MGNSFDKKESKAVGSCEAFVPWRRDLVPVERHDEAPLAVGVNDGGLVHLKRSRTHVRDPQKPLKLK